MQKSDPEEIISEVAARTPLPLSLQFELEALLSGPDVTVVEQVEVFESQSTLSPDKEQILNRVRNIIREEQKRAKFKGLFSKRNVITAMAILFVSTTAYVTVDTWLTNNAVKAETATLRASDGVVDIDGTISKDQEGRDETKPTGASLSKYIVGATFPRALYIDKLGIAARVLPMSVNNDGSIQSPRNIYDAGWYSGSVKPGEVGAMFIDGHASGPTREGLFAYLDKFVEGDEIQIEKGDNTRLTYRVVHTEVVNLADVDMKKMLLPYGNALRALNLMTCTGNWVESDMTYDQRVLVWTEQV
jgi:LPXTG-site transpeptidase (sortase) family protein